jgi:hypothetical protein
MANVLKPALPRKAAIWVEGTGRVPGTKRGGLRKTCIKRFRPTRTASGATIIPANNQKCLRK